MNQIIQIIDLIVQTILLGMMMIQATALVSVVARRILINLLVVLIVSVISLGQTVILALFSDVLSKKYVVVTTTVAA